MPDRFVLDGDVLEGARDIIVLELVSNPLTHREHTSPFPAKLTIGGSGRWEGARHGL